MHVYYWGAFAIAGVLLSHSNIQSQVSCLHQAWGWTQRDTLLHCLPLHHTHGIVNALLCPLHLGARYFTLHPTSSLDCLHLHLWRKYLYGDLTYIFIYLRIYIVAFPC